MNQDSLDTKTFLAEKVSDLEKSLDAAQLSLDNYEQHLERSMQITASFSLLHLDQLCVVVLIGKCYTTLCIW